MNFTISHKVILVVATKFAQLASIGNSTRQVAVVTKIAVDIGLCQVSLRLFVDWNIFAQFGNSLILIGVMTD